MFRRARILTAILSLAVAMSAQAGTPIEKMALGVEHPILGLVFDAKNTQFERLPAALRKMCKLDKIAGYFIMARLTAGDTDVIVTIGRLPGPDDNLFGVVLETKDGHCETMDSLGMQMGWLPAGPLPVSAPTASLIPGLGAPEICVNGECHYILRSQEELGRLRALVQDALTRAEAALGGKENVKQDLCSSSVPSDPRMPEVAKMLTAYCQP